MITTVQLLPMKTTSRTNKYLQQKRNVRLHLLRASSVEYTMASLIVLLHTACTWRFKSCHSIAMSSRRNRCMLMENNYCHARTRWRGCISDYSSMLSDESERNCCETRTGVLRWQHVRECYLTNVSGIVAQPKLTRAINTKLRSHVTPHVTV